ncbi:DUF3841 domain-containing protein [Heyndrickxia sp. NPDC080065]|uniref:DUF3841 domain-containing protein n=1 Tax=Heyndrickxia sp. NPDC080065 TaxID=3390568 RepID=UPI003CFD5DE9
MIVYTVQHIEAYKQMRELGYLEGSEKYLWKEFKEPYNWMKKQMEKRISNYIVGKSYPIWVWRRRVNRNERSLLSPGTRGVILTLEIQDNQIVWSDFDSWHFVLNNCPITDSEAEWDDYLKDESSFPVIDSWEKIFNFDYFRNADKEWNGHFDEEWIQRVTPRITMEQVKKVTRFIAK